MLYSMTGFGKGQAMTQTRNISIEIKTLNSKQMDCFLKLPNFLKSKEVEIRNLFNAELIRGKLDIYINVENIGGKMSQSIHQPTFEAYYNELKELAIKMGEPTDHLLSNVLRNPDVFVKREEEIEEEDWKMIYAALKEAVAQVNEFRKQEGAVLEKELSMRLEMILEHLKSVEAIDKTRLDMKREKLQLKLTELLGAENFDKNRLEQELVFYMEKLDITEEIVRLNAHCILFDNTMKEQGIDKGRKLNFIAQEMGREINTIGSKANDKDLQNLVIKSKDELEKIKEQVNNVL